MDRLAVVLIGGKSSRMGFDKSLIDYHGKPHRYYLLDMLQSLGFDAFLSGRAEQQDTNAGFVVDEYPDCGPISGILSALKIRKNSSCLILSCDQPLVDTQLIEFLWNKAKIYDDSVLMDCFYKESMPASPESLPSVWKTDSLAWVERSLESERYAIRDILPPDRIALHLCPDYRRLLNINTPHQRQSWIEGDKKRFISPYDTNY